MSVARLLAALTAVLAASCSRAPAPDGRASPAASAAPVGSGAHPSIRRVLTVSAKLAETGRITVQAAVLATPHDDFTVTGEATAPPDGVAEVGAPTAGLVRSVLAKEGDRVAKGATLATLDAAEVARTATDLGRAEARRAHAAQVLEQEERLMRENATSERRLAEAKSELATAQAEARGAHTLLTTFGAAGGGRAVVKSPIGGTVVARTIVLGKPVEAGALLFRIVSPEKLLVRADVPENDAAEVTAGTEATLTWAARKTSCNGVVESRAPSVDPTTRTVPFRVRPAAGCPELVEGGFVDVTLPRPAPQGTTLLAVPRDALVELDAVPLVFVAGASPGEYRAAPVRVARLSTTTAYLEDGVAPGDLVVVTGAILLKGELMRAALE